MHSHDEAAQAIGKQVYNRKNNAKLYMVEKSNKEEVYLRALSKGSRSTWKWIGLLWHDYAEVGAQPEHQQYAASEQGSKE